MLRGVRADAKVQLGIYIENVLNKDQKQCKVTGIVFCCLQDADSSKNISHHFGGQFWVHNYHSVLFTV